MKFLKLWNKFFFIPKYNVFDLIVLLIAVHLIITESWWWALMYIPTTVFSVMMQMKVEKND